MNIQELFAKSNTALNNAVQQLSSEQLENITMPSYATSSKDRGLRAFVNMCAYENDCVPDMLQGKEGILSNQENATDYVEGDFKANFAQLAESANAAVLACTEQDLERTVHMSYMDATARDYLNDIVLQRTLAAIDIAQATGVPLDWSDELAKELWDTITPNAETLRSYGVFPAEVTVSADAPIQDRLLGLMGRNPSAS